MKYNEILSFLRFVQLNLFQRLNVWFYLQLQIFSNIISLHVQFFTYRGHDIFVAGKQSKQEVRMCLHDKHSHDRASHISSSDGGKERSCNFSAKMVFPTTTSMRKIKVCFW